MGRSFSHINHYSNGMHEQLETGQNTDKSLIGTFLHIKSKDTFTLNLNRLGVVWSFIQMPVNDQAGSLENIQNYKIVCLGKFTTVFQAELFVCAITGTAIVSESLFAQMVRQCLKHWTQTLSVQKWFWNVTKAWWSIHRTIMWQFSKMPWYLLQ